MTKIGDKIGIMINTNNGNTTIDAKNNIELLSDFSNITAAIRDELLKLGETPENTTKIIYNAFATGMDDTIYPILP